jgi:hypothetical protein
MRTEDADPPNEPSGDNEREDGQNNCEGGEHERTDLKLIG